MRTSSAKAGIRHSPADNLQVPITMFEMIDDSIIFSTSLDHMINKCRMMERFQILYNWMTQWPKLTIYAVNHSVSRLGRLPPSILIPSIHTNDLCNPSDNWVAVGISTDHIEFLRVHINNTAARYTELEDFTYSFVIPSALPITALRKVINQVFLPKVRARLVLKPVRPTNAARLRTRLMSLIHTYLHLPFSVSPDLLSLPISHQGFGFPSFSRLNAAISLAAVQRDLNHHIALFSNLACITLANWTYSVNAYSHPFSPPSISPTHHVNFI